MILEQYEYLDWIVTIGEETWYREGKIVSKNLYGFSVMKKYAHLFDPEDYAWADITYGDLDDDAIEPFEGWIYDVIDTRQDKFTKRKPLSISDIREILIFNVNSVSGIDCNMKPVLVQQIKKRVVPKSSKKQRGFNQVAWSAMVKLRDKKCMECGSQYKLHAHHIQPFATNEDLRYDVNNGITLCEKCHKAKHKVRSKSISLS